MCNPASFVLTKESVFWSRKSDSHEDIIKEHALHDGGMNPEPNILRVEIAPDDGDIFSDPAGWVYKKDQDILPHWHDPAEDEKRARIALKEWVAARVFIGVNGKVFDADEVVFVKNSVIDRVEKTAEIRILMGGQVRLVRENGQVREVRGNGQVGEVWGNGQVGVVRGNGQVRLVRENGQVREVRENGQVGEVWGNGQVREVRENGQVGEVWGNGQVGEVWGNGQVREVRGNGQVREVRGNGQVGEHRGAVVICYGDNICVPLSPRSVVIDRRGPVSICHVGEAKP